MNEKETTNQPLTLPLVALRDIVIYPKMTISLDIGRKESIAAVRQAMKSDRYLVGVMLKDPSVDELLPDNIYTVGTVLKIVQMLQLPGGLIRVLVEGVARVKVENFVQEGAYATMDVNDIEEVQPEDALKAEAYRRTILKSFFDWLRNTKQGLPDDQMERLKAIEDAGETADFIASQLLIKPKKRQELLEEVNVMARLMEVKRLQDKELAIGQLENEINNDARKKMDKEQQDYYLRQKIKSIHDKLGDTSNQEEETENYRKKLKESGIPEEYKEKLSKEIDHLAAMPPMMAETAVARNYLDWVFGLPWKTESQDILDLKRAKEILDADHYGLTKIKDRILEY